jgi:EpsI family protein
MSAPRTAAAAGLAIGVLAVYREPLLALVRQWDASPMYSYGYVVPFISAYLVVARKDRLAAIAIAPAKIAGAAILALSWMLLAFGRINAIQVIEQLSFIGAICGVVLVLFGTRHLLLCSPAIAYLLFMMPIWDVFTEPLHWTFQINSAKLGVWMMQTVGIPVFREQTIVVLPNLTFEVARECSGVNYLVAVLAIALPLSWMRLQQPWRRATLVGTSLLVAAMANSLRVALIGTLSYAEIGSPLHGPFHVLHGLFVAGIGFVVIFVGLRVLEERGHSTRPMAVKASTSTSGSWRIRDAVGLALLFWAVASAGVAPQARSVDLDQPLESLPRQLGKWSADPMPWPALGPAPSAINNAWRSADGQLERRYRSEAGAIIEVKVFYFAKQTQGREIISSTSADLHRDASRVAIGANSGRFEANRVHWPDRNQTALFWYESGERPEAGQVATKLNTMWAAIARRRTNGAAIVLRTSSDYPNSMNELLGFAEVLRPALVSLWTPSVSE